MSGQISEFQLFLGNERLFQQILSDINKATKRIHIQMYIIADDTCGNKLKNALIKKANENVDIFIIADAYGSKELPDKFVTELKENGIKFRFFNQINPLKNFRFGRRLHHKIITIDTTIAYVGGINIADKYFIDNPWLDFMVRITNTTVIKSLVIICENIYHKKIFKKNKTSPIVLINDFARNQIEISRTYKKLISKARHRIVIVAAYFIPSLSFRRKLKKAAKRNTTITFVTGKTSDVKLIKYATEHLYLWLLKNNINIYEYQPSVVHGKLLNVDYTETTVGSYNLNRLSDIGSIELNLLLTDKKLNQQVTDIYSNVILNNSKKIDINYTRHLSFPTKLRNYISYYLVRIGLRFITFFNRREPKLHKT